MWPQRLNSSFHLYSHIIPLPRRNSLSIIYY
jgi:hypothetical protein